MSATEQEVTPLQRARMRAAAQAIAAGKVTFQLVCGHCDSSSLYHDPDKGGDVLTCAACGMDTSSQTAHRIRKQKITAYIRKGIDL